MILIRSVYLLLQVNFKETDKCIPIKSTGYDGTRNHVLQQLFGLKMQRVLRQQNRKAHTEAPILTKKRQIEYKTAYKLID